MNYTSADRELHHKGHGGKLQSRKVGNNTYLKRRGEDIALRLHDTDVVLFHPDGTVTLNTGGWYTATTKDRMGYVDGIRVFSDRGKWWVQHLKHGWSPEGRIPYFDGIRLNPESGEIVGDAAEQLQRLEEDEVHNAEIEKKIKAYVRGFSKPEVFQPLAQEILRNKSFGGDCWFCSMHSVKDGRTLGDLSDSEHLIAHLEERYYMGSVIYNAVRDRNYRDPNFIFHMILRDLAKGVWPRDLSGMISNHFRARLYRGPHAKNKNAALAASR